jgi:hypothetical protein
MPWSKILKEDLTFSCHYVFAPPFPFSLSFFSVCSRWGLSHYSYGVGGQQKSGLLSVFLFHGFRHVFCTVPLKCVILCWHSGNHDITHVGWKCLSETLRMRRKRLTFFYDKTFLNHQNNNKKIISLDLRQCTSYSNVKNERTNAPISFWKRNQNGLVSFLNLSC